MADIVLVEDEDVQRRYLTGTLRQLEHTVRAAESAEDGLRLIEEGEPDILLTDQRLPGKSGHDMLLEVKEAHPNVAVIMLTAHGTMETAVDAMRSGASDYLSKPINRDELDLVINRCLASAGLKNELEYYRRKDLAGSAIDGIVGSSPAVRELREMVLRLAAPEKKGGGGPTVLITGETGTGKGLVARALHSEARRSNSPFIEVNCAAVPENLLEAELMGYEKGAFTGATNAKPGLFEAAEAGTIFLDEIGRMGPDLQAKLLKVIDERTLRRLGSTRQRPMRCSVVTATHLDIEEAVREGRFLEDLYHRVNVFRIKCPPLRGRGEDVLQLAEHFLGMHAAEYGVPVPVLGDRAQAALVEYDWPGNVRELAHVMERAVVLGGAGTIDVGEIKMFSLSETVASGGTGAVASIDDLRMDFSHGPLPLEEFEAALIRQAFEFTGRNRKKTAKLLGISSDTLRYRLDKFGLV